MPSASLLDRLGHAFRQPELLAQALTHRSHGATHNERLEFVGDAVLNCVVAAVLFERFPAIPEGELSRVRASLVNRDTLAAARARLALGGEVLLGEGELRSGGADRPSILADALEAVFGAVFVDAGFDAARGGDRADLSPTEFADLDPATLGKDPKTRLQEWLQARRIAVPGIRGDEHRRRGARADVHDRMPHSRARRRDERHGHEPPRGGAGGRGDARMRESSRSFERRAWWLTSAMPATFAAATSRSSAGRTSASRRCSTAWSARTVSITSRKAQTTRHRITGILTDAGRAVRVRRHAGLPDAAPLAPQRPDEPRGHAKPRRRRRDRAWSSRPGARPTPTAR